MVIAVDPDQFVARPHVGAAPVATSVSDETVVIRPDQSVRAAAAAADQAAAQSADAGQPAAAAPAAWPWFVEKPEPAVGPVGSAAANPAPVRESGPAGNVGAAPAVLPKRTPQEPPGTTVQPGGPPLFEASGPAAFPLTSRPSVSRIRPTFGDDRTGADEPADEAWPLPQRPSTTLPPVSSNSAAPATEPAPQPAPAAPAGPTPFDAFSAPARVTPAADAPWPGSAAEAAGSPGPGQALVDALLPSRLLSRQEIRPASEIRLEPEVRPERQPAPAEPLAGNGYPPAPADSRPRPDRYEEGPTEVLGPFDIGMWSDGGEVDARRSLPRRSRRTRPDEDGADEHGSPDQRRVAITPAAVEQARARASSRSGGAGSGPPKPPKPPKTPKTRGDRIRTGIRGAGQTMITLGLVVLLFVVYELWVTDLFNSRTQHKLSTTLQKDWEQGDDPLVTAPPSGPAKPGTKVTRIPLGKGIANIYIPAFGPDYVFTVVEGTGANQLAEGPGHYPTSALPGQVGNFSIAGHRVGKGSPFLNLDKLRAGDAIVIETKSFWYTYRVLGDKATGDTAHGTLGIPGKQIVAPTDVDVVRPVPGRPATARAQYPFITLTTCHPKFSARQRLIIHGQLEGKPWPKSQGDPPALQG